MAVVSFQNPLGALERHSLTVRAATLKKAVALSKIDHARPFVVTVNGKPVLRKDWLRKRLYKNSAVTVMYLPRGGGRSGGGKQIAAAVAMIALSVMAPMVGGAVAGAFGLSGTAAVAAKGIAGGVFAMGGSMLVNKFMAPKSQKQAESPVGISGGGNLPRPLDTIPVIYGRVWTQPDLSQPDFMDYAGKDPVLRKRMTIGLGNYDLLAIRVGNTLIWDKDSGYADGMSELVRHELIGSGGTSQLVPSALVSSTEVMAQELPEPKDGTWVGWYAVSAPGVKVNELRIDFSAPGGFYSINKNGNEKNSRADLVAEYQLINDAGQAQGAVFNFFTETVTALTKNPEYWTRRKVVPLGRYRVRFRRTNNYPASQGSHVVNWDALRGALPDQALRYGVTELALEVTARKGMNISSWSDVWVQVVRRLPVWNGTAWVEQASRSAMWAAHDALTDTRYGGSLPSARINRAELIRIDAIAAGREDYFDLVIRGPMALREAVAMMLRVVRTEPVIMGGTWTFVRDEPRVIPRFVLDRRRIVRGSTSESYRMADEDGVGDVIVEYEREGDPKLQDEVRATVGPAALRPKRIRIPGISAYAQAWREAHYEAARDYYRRKTIEVSTELDGRLLWRGAPGLIDISYQDTSATLGILSLSGTTLTLDSTVTVAAGWEAYLRGRRGQEWGPVRVAQGGNTSTIVLNAADVTAVQSATGQSLASVAMPLRGERGIVMLGPLGKVAESCLISGVIPNGLNSVSIVAVNDDPLVYSADGSTPPPEPPLPAPPALERPTIALFDAVRKQATSALELHWTLVPPAGAERYSVEISYDGGETRLSIHNGAATSGHAPVDWSEMWVYVRAFGKTGLPGAEVVRHIFEQSVQVIATGAEAGSIGREAFDAAMEADWAAMEGAAQSANALAETARQTANNLRKALSDNPAERASVAGNVSVSVVENAARLARLVNDLQVTQKQRDDGQTATVITLKEGIAVQMGEAFAAITNEKDLRVAADLAQASEINAVTATLGNKLDASIFTQTMVEVNTALGEKASATELNAVQTSLNGKVDASVFTQYQSTVSSELNGKANSSALTAVEAKADNATAQGLFKIEAMVGANPSGVSARFGMYLRQISGGNFSSNAGMMLELLTNGTSRAVFDASSFTILNGTARAAPFVVEGGDVYIQSAYIKNLTAEVFNYDAINQIVTNATKLSSETDVANMISLGQHSWVRFDVTSNGSTRTAMELASGVLRPAGFPSYLSQISPNSSGNFTGVGPWVNIAQVTINGIPPAPAGQLNKFIIAFQVAGEISTHLAYNSAGAFLTKTGVIQTRLVRGASTELDDANPIVVFDGNGDLATERRGVTVSDSFAGGGNIIWSLQARYRPYYTEPDSSNNRRYKVHNVFIKSRSLVVQWVKR